jgi:uncharacterized protein YjbI with pentapeptide repeats
MRVPVALGSLAIAMTVSIMLPAYAYDDGDFERFNGSNSSARCDLRGADLMRQSHGEAQLSHANLREADLQDVVMPGSYLVGIDQRRANVERVNLSGSDMTGSNLSGGDFEKATLANVILV